MSDKTEIIDSLLKKFFDSLAKDTQKRTAEATQDFISRGLYNSTACTNALLAVHYEVYEKQLEGLFLFVDEKGLALEWDNLKAKLNDLTRGVCARAKSQASQHLVNASLASLIKQFQQAIKRKEKELNDQIANRIQLATMLSSYTERQEGVDTFEQILSIIRHGGRSFEATPQTFSQHDEEGLRNIIIAHLNSQYKGMATGETLRQAGKTDIRIENEERVAFIAECKVWRGRAELGEAIDQLLSYLTWRDCNAALVVFNKHNAGFKQIQDQIPEILQSHSNFVSHVECDTDGEWRCVVCSHDDPDRKIVVHVFVFNLY
jgi:hypothetical protein